MFSRRSIERLAGAFLVTGLVALLAHGLTLDQGVVPVAVLLVLVYGFMIILSALLVVFTCGGSSSASGCCNC